MVISSTLHMNENFALRLALKRRQTRTRKWPIATMQQLLPLGQARASSTGVVGDYVPRWLH